MGRGQRIAAIVGTGFVALSLLGGLAAHGSVGESVGSSNGFLHICSYSNYDTSHNRCLRDQTSGNPMDMTDVFGWANTAPILVDVQVQDGTGRWVTQGPGHGEVDSGDSTTGGDNKVVDLLDGQGVAWGSITGQIRFVAYDTSGYLEGSYTLSMSG